MNRLKSALMISAMMIVGMVANVANAQWLLERVPADSNSYGYSAGKNAELMKTS